MKHVEFGTRNVTPWPFAVQYGLCVPVLKLEPCFVANYACAEDCKDKIEKKRYTHNLEREMVREAKQRRLSKAN